MKDRVTITISLKPHLQDFLRHEFKSDPNGTIVINKRENIGLYLNSMWTVSDLPVKREYEFPCTIALPIRPDNHYIFSHNFIYIPVWRENQISDYIEAEFRLRIREFFTIGYEKQFKQKHIIDGFLQAYNIKNNALNFDMIKKLDYRNRRNFAKRIAKEVQLSLFE